jgi:ubiquinone/menaquinone biosynthesis C-methylase UbiE
MSVSAHLRIDLAEYDSRIRTFVPNYEHMIRIAGQALRFANSEPTIVDLGVGTGALAAACLEVRPDAELLGLDIDSGMLKAAKTRLAAYPHVKLVEADFLQATLPACDAIVACIALHHVRTSEAKRTFYAQCGAALHPSGILITADCFPGVEPALAAEHQEAWLAHLERSYSRTAAEAYLASWAEDDVYFPLESELVWLREAGLRPEVLWRVDGFAVLAAFAATA